MGTGGLDDWGHHRGGCGHSPLAPPHRLSLRKSWLLTRAARGFRSKPLTRAPESRPGSQSFDYIPLVSAPDPVTPQKGLPVNLPPPCQGQRLHLPTQVVACVPDPGSRSDARSQRRRHGCSLQFCCLHFKTPWGLCILLHHLCESVLSTHKDQPRNDSQVGKINAPGTCTVFSKWLCRHPSMLWQAEKPRSAVGVSELRSKGAWPCHIWGPAGLGDQMKLERRHALSYTVELRALHPSTHRLSTHPGQHSAAHLPTQQGLLSHAQRYTLGDSPELDEHSP